MAGNRDELVVYIFYGSSEVHLQWLLQLLSTAPFQRKVKQVKFLPIAQECRDDYASGSVAILYYTLLDGRIRETDNRFTLYEYLLRSLSEKLGREKVMVMVDDANDDDVEKGSRLLEFHPPIRECFSQLLTLSQEDKKNAAASRTKCGQIMAFIEENWHKYNLHEERQTNMTKDRTQSPALGGDIKGPAPSGAAPQPMEVTPRMPKIHFGIFSRTTKDKYGWMTELLKSETFKDSVADVCDIYISNAFLQFTEKVSRSQCTFAILYHTKDHGRINITDVTDSLYDKELRYLSDTLGKENVIVVVDDLEDSSSEEKRRILQNQPSIGTLARGLILFSEKDKKSLFMDTLAWGHFDFLRMKTQCREK